MNLISRIEKTAVSVFFNRNRIFASSPWVFYNETWGVPET
jgi:hypothetical protein